MDALKVRERYVREAMTQAEIMGKAARELERLQREMQAGIDRALVRPSASGCGKVLRLAWLESFEPEGGLRAQVDAAARATRMGFLADDNSNRRAEALEALLSGEDAQQQPTLWALLAPHPRFQDMARKASEVQLRCAATTDRTRDERDDAPGAHGPAARVRAARARAEEDKWLGHCPRGSAARGVSPSESLVGHYYTAAQGSRARCRPDPGRGLAGLLASTRVGWGMQ